MASPSSRLNYEDNPVFSLGEFNEKEEIYLQQIRDSYLGNLARNLVVELTSLGLRNVFKDEAIIYIQGDANLSLNTDTYSEQDKKLEQSIENTKAKYQSIKNDVFLLIAAPKPGEEFMREQQYKNVCQAYPSMNDDNTHEVVVHSKKELLEEVKKFQENNPNVFVSHIVFNGHGSKDGSLIVYKEDVKKAGGKKVDVKEEDLKKEYVDLIDFLNEVLLTCKSKLVGHKIEVIFGQCYAHLYKDKVLKNPLGIPIDIICFTDDQHPTTINLKNWNTADGKVNWIHLQPQKHAEDKQEEINLPADVDKMKIGDN